MRKAFLLLFTLAAAAVFYGCNHSPAPPGKENAELSRSWCRRYTGTIAGMPVTVILYNQPLPNNDALCGGTYYYNNKSELLTLGPLIADSVNSSIIHTFEYRQTDRAYMSYEGQTPDTALPAWDITITDNTITGKWHSADRKKTHNISLTEDYKGAGRLAFVQYHNSREVIRKHDTASLSSSVTVTVPSDAMASIDNEGAAFVSSEILHFLDGSSTHAASLSEFPRKSVEQYIRGGDSLLPAEDDPDPVSLQFYQNTALLPIYFDHGILVVQEHWTEYAGGAHDMYGNRELCLDVANRKTLHLADVVKMDTAALEDILGQEARKQLGSDGLLVDTVPPTGNFIIADRGITFCYSPYEIASFADGQVFLFLPYTRLTALLQDDFKKRMGL